MLALRCQWNRQDTLGGWNGVALDVRERRRVHNSSRQASGHGRQSVTARDQEVRVGERVEDDDEPVSHSLVQRNTDGPNNVFSAHQVVALLAIYTSVDHFRGANIRNRGLFRCWLHGRE
jgi:hypothetical protein